MKTIETIYYALIYVFGVLMATYSAYTMLNSQFSINMFLIFILGISIGVYARVKM